MRKQKAPENPALDVDLASDWCDLFGGTALSHLAAVLDREQVIAR